MNTDGASITIHDLNAWDAACLIHLAELFKAEGHKVVETKLLAPLFWNFGEGFSRTSQEYPAFMGSIQQLRSPEEYEEWTKIASEFERYAQTIRKALSEIE